MKGTKVFLKKKRQNLAEEEKEKKHQYGPE